MKKIIIITGGCQGLGKEIAKRLSKENTVVIFSREEDKLKSTAKEFSCDYSVCDISDSENVKSSVKYVLEKYKKIDVLINNAGIWIAGELDDCDYSDIARLTLVNTVGTINMTKAVLFSMKKEKSGKIINIVSVNGLEGKADRSLYTSSKFAITGFTDSMRKELEKYNISVMGFYPGPMKTSLFKNAGVERDLTNMMDPSEVSKIIEFALDLDDIVLEKVVFRGLHS